MQMPLQLTLRSMAHSDALAVYVRRRADRLERASARIISCHVVVELVDRHHRHGNRYRVTVNVAVPGHEIIVSHVPSDERRIGTAGAATSRAFDEVDQQLEHWVGRQREDRHEKALT